MGVPSKVCFVLLAGGMGMVLAGMTVLPAIVAALVFAWAVTS